MDGESIYSFSRADIRALDHAAVNDYCIPVLVLMENAARSIADTITYFESDRDVEHYRPVLILCGKGNNGGDGLALARHLVNRNFSVSIALAFNPEQTDLSHEVHTHLQIAHKMGIPIFVIDQDQPESSLDDFLGKHGLEKEPILVIDALLGTGINSPPRSSCDRIIKWINKRGRQFDSSVVAVDIPTGLDCDSGEPLGQQAVRAHLTVSLVGLKDAFFNPDASTHLGITIIGDIGIPSTLLRKFGMPHSEDILFGDNDDEDDDDFDQDEY